MKPEVDKQELEQSFVNLYENISPITLKEFHSLMKEYVEVLNTLKNKKSGSQDLKENFLEKIRKEKGLEFVTLKDINWILNDKYAEYNDCAIPWIYMQKSGLRNKVIISNPLSLGSISDDHIFNSVMEGKKPKDICYNLGFDNRKKPLAENGLFIGKFKVENDLTWIDFPKESHLKRALYQKDGNLVRVSIKLYN